MKRLYPLAVTWFMLGTLATALLFVLIGSPAHTETDPLFWFITINAVGLFVLSVMLHHEKDEEERENFIRVFFLADWLIGLAMASSVIWKNLQAGTFWPR